MTQPFEHYVLHSGKLSVSVLPSLGGRLTELTDLVSSRQWLWRNHSVPLGVVSHGSEYDNVWQGGFEELFPNDAPTTIGGLAYPDHGELWSIPWQVGQTTADSLELNVVGPVTGVTVTKTINVNESDLILRYQLQHDGDWPIPHLFKLHPALDIHNGCLIDLPGGTVEKVEAGFGNILESTALQAWPTGKDLARCRDRDSRTNEFVYVSDLPEGRCGVVDLVSGSKVDIYYPMDVFPYCWIFMTYGGWRDHNVVVLEPCTNYPKDLQEAISTGTNAVLTPGETKEFEVKVSVGAIDD